MPNGNTAGVDIHCLGGNIPSGFVGKRNYDKYILPLEKRYTDWVQKNATPAMYHNRGLVSCLIESYKELGPRAPNLSHRIRIRSNTRARTRLVLIVGRGRSRPTRTVQGGQVTWLTGSCPCCSLP